MAKIHNAHDEVPVVVVNDLDNSGCSNTSANGKVQPSEEGESIEELADEVKQEVLTWRGTKKLYYILCTWRILYTRKMRGMYTVAVYGPWRINPWRYHELSPEREKPKRVFKDGNLPVLCTLTLFLLITSFQFLVAICLTVSTMSFLTFKERKGFSENVWHFSGHLPRKTGNGARSLPTDGRDAVKIYPKSRVEQSGMGCTWMDG